MGLGGAYIDGAITYVKGFSSSGSKVPMCTPWDAIAIEPSGDRPDGLDGLETFIDEHCAWDQYEDEAIKAGGISCSGIQAELAGEGINVPLECRLSLGAVGG